VLEQPSSLKLANDAVKQTLPEPDRTVDWGRRVRRASTSLGFVGVVRLNATAPDNSTGY
jgi:hypothetical protein